MSRDYLGTLTRWGDVLKNMRFGDRRIEVRKEKKEEEEEEKEE